MATHEKERWDSKHTAENEPGEPAAFLREVIQSGPWQIQPGRALDIATGKGRNALFLAENGFEVDAIDISEAGLRQARKHAEAHGRLLNLIQADLASFEFPDSAYDLILNINFLLRPIIPGMKKALRPGGHIIFDTYLIDQQVMGHPRNPAYLLQHNELLDPFGDFRILCYREGKFLDGGKESYRAQLLGEK